MKTNLVTLAISLGLALNIACGGSKKPVEEPAPPVADCSECEAKVSALEAEVAGANALADRRKALFDNLKQQLAGLVSAGKVSIVFRRGLLVIQLPTEILFELGKATLNKDGAVTLGQVAASLKGVEDRRFIVAGHTDNVPVARKARAYKSNWELSALRGIAVVENLIAAGVKAEQLGAAGFSEFDPVADNTVPEERAKNRRIEIIVMPNLESLFKPAE